MQNTYAILIKTLSRNLFMSFVELRKIPIPYISLLIFLRIYQDSNFLGTV